MIIVTHENIESLYTRLEKAEMMIQYFHNKGNDIATDNWKHHTRFLKGQLKQCADVLNRFANRQTGTLTHKIVTHKVNEILQKIGENLEG